MTTDKPTINIIAAIGQNRELGKDGNLLWYIPEDLKHFKDLTNGHPVIMGRKTFESLPPKFRPLPNRTNIIVTRNADFQPENTLTASSINDAINQAAQAPGGNEIFIIGGGQIYAEALPLADQIYLTLVEKSFPEADTFFPEYQSIFTKETARENKNSDELNYSFVVLTK